MSDERVRARKSASNAAIQGIADAVTDSLIKAHGQDPATFKCRPAMHEAAVHAVRRVRALAHEEPEMVEQLLGYMPKKWEPKQSLGQQAVEANRAFHRQDPA